MSVHPSRGVRRRVVSGALLAGAGATLAPTRAEAALDRRTIAARRRFFGAANIERDGRPRRDRVVLSWFGVANFALAIGGRVVLLDAWIPRGTHSGYVPVGVDDLVALRPREILIGHGHFDHAGDAPVIAAATGATVIGTAEHCAQAAADAPAPIRTRALMSERDQPGALRAFRLGRRIRVEALLHTHSAFARPTGDDAPLLPLPDLTPCLTHPPTLTDILDTLAGQTDAEGGALLYRLRFGSFSLVWHDSAGPVAAEAPAALRAMRRMRRPDVQVGSIQGFGQYTNGLRDPMYYVEALRPRVFVPAHHDNWLPPISANASAYEGRMRESLAGMAGPRPRLRFLRDPADYVRPERLTFRVR